MKNQGACGSCWAFVATAVNEGRAAMKNITYSTLSEQQLVSCSTMNQGCTGGWMATAWSYVAVSGQVSDATYPYTNEFSSKTEPCIDSLLQPALVKDDDPTIYLTTESELKAALMEGPVAVAIAAGNSCFSSYQSGILSCKCPNSVPDLDHAITLVGWGEDYWIGKNQWSASWGMEGYVLLAMKNYPGQCGMWRYPGYPTNVVRV